MSGGAGASRALLTGGTALGVAMVVANIGNYALNLFLGRWLTPAQFSDASLMVTLMLTLTSIALCLQLVAARFVGAHDAKGESAASDRIIWILRRWALGAGMATVILLAGPSLFWERVFHTASPWPFVILSLGMPFYLVQSVGRGVMQGRLQFRPLAITFLVEMAVRLGLGVLLVTLGAGVNGATLALSISFAATYLAVRLLGSRRPALDGAQPDIAVIRAYAASVSILLLGQIIASNSDVFAAKGFFTPHDAGVYSAVALVGRAVFFLSWSVATVVFPAVAHRHAGGGDTGALLRGGILAVVGIGLVCTIGAFLVGGPVLRAVLGSAYGGLSEPLAAYAGMTTLFAVANLIASYDLSRGRVRTSWQVLTAAILQVVLLLVWHQSIGALILAQTIAMSLLIATMAVDPILTIRAARSLPREASAQL